MVDLTDCYSSKTVHLSLSEVQVDKDSVQLLIGSLAFADLAGKEAIALFGRAVAYRRAGKESKEDSSLKVDPNLNSAKKFDSLTCLFHFGFENLIHPINQG